MTYTWDLMTYAAFPFNHTYWSIPDALRYGEMHVDSKPIMASADVWPVEAHFGYPVIYSTV